jgi:hypothetical protein
MALPSSPSLFSFPLLLPRSWLSHSSTLISTLYLSSFSCSFFHTLVSHSSLFSDNLAFAALLLCSRHSRTLSPLTLSSCSPFIHLSASRLLIPLPPSSASLSLSRSLTLHPFLLSSSHYLPPLLPRTLTPPLLKLIRLLVAL